MNRFISVATTDETYTCIHTITCSIVSIRMTIPYLKMTFLESIRTMCGKVINDDSTKRWYVGAWNKILLSKTLKDLQVIAVILKTGGGTLGIGRLIIK